MYQNIYVTNIYAYNICTIIHMCCNLREFALCLLTSSWPLARVKRGSEQNPKHRLRTAAVSGGQRRPGLSTIPLCDLPPLQRYCHHLYNFCVDLDIYLSIWDLKSPPPPPPPPKLTQLAIEPQGRVFVVETSYGAHSTRLGRKFHFGIKFLENRNFFGFWWLVSTFTKGRDFDWKIFFRFSAAYMVFSSMFKIE